MHRCLQIDELLALIATHIYHPHLCANRLSGVDDIISMALTCRTFYEPMMDHRWSVLPGLDPLIRCLPEDALDTDTVYDRSDGWDVEYKILKISRTLLPYELERFAHHARRVRILHLLHQSAANGGDYYKAADDSCLEMLKVHYPESPMVPNIHSLEYCDHKGTFGPYLPMFMPSSLQRLEHCHWTALSAIQLLECARTHAPNLRAFNTKIGAAWVRRNISEPPLLTRLTDAVSSLPYITCLKLCASYEGEALLHLASLPRLVEFSCTVNHLNCKSLTSSKSLMFSNLNLLEVWGADEDDGPCHIVYFLRNIRPHSLHRLHVFAYTTPRFNLVGELLEAISRFDTLNILALTFEDAKTRPSPSPAPDSVLQPLETLRSLQCIHINELSIDFTGPGLNRLAKMWPNITKIDMYRCSAPSSQVRLCDLLPFARYPPHLKSLKIDIPQWQVMPPREKFEDEEHLRDALSHLPAFTSPLQSLHVGELPTDNLSPDVVTHIAAFLVDFFPSAQIHETLSPVRVYSFVPGEFFDRLPRIYTEQQRLRELRRKEEAASLEVEVIGIEESSG